MRAVSMILADEVPSGPESGLRMFSELVGLIGKRHFYPRLSAMLGDICGAEHVHYFLYEEERPRVLSSISLDGSERAHDQATRYMDHGLWRHDPEISRAGTIASGRPALIHVETAKSNSYPVRDFYHHQRLAEQYLLCGRTPCGAMGLSMVRSHSSGEASGQLSQRLLTATEILFPILGKHVEVCNQSKLMLDALTSLHTIEQVLAAAGTLPERQQQVCARFLYGMSASLIASDTNLSIETIMSYRKRIYQRLEIASHRELIMWYLSVHDDMIRFDLPFRHGTPAS